MLRNGNWKVVAALAAVLQSGCASDIMKSYVGQSLVQPIMDYGPPQNAFDIGDGTRAFVWTMHNSYTTPGYATTTGYFSGTGSAVGYAGYSTIDSSGLFNSYTYYQPPTTTAFTCNYVIFAKRNDSGIDGPAAWSVVGFKQPSLGCE